MIQRGNPFSDNSIGARRHFSGVCHTTRSIGEAQVNMKHPRLLRYLLSCAVPGLFALSAACSSGSTSQTGVPEADGGSSTSVDGATVAPLGPKETCAKYIQCVSEVKPDLAGPLVSVYGEASTCWQGSLADSEACGRACASSDSVPGCKPISLKRHYAAVCVKSFGSTAGILRFDAEVNYDGERGDITMKLLQYNPATYEPSFSLVDVPTISLKRAALGGRGESTTFNTPARTFFESSKSAVSFEVEELREKESRICSSISYAEEGSPVREMGNCVYLPLTAGDPWPQLDEAKIHSCE